MSDIAVILTLKYILFIIGADKNDAIGLILFAILIQLLRMDM